MNAIMKRETVEEIVANRNRALELYEVAYDKTAEADNAVREAHAMARRSHPGHDNRYTHIHAAEVEAFQSAVSLPDKATYLRTARRIVDLNVWAYVIERTDIERLMDAQEKEKMREQMSYIPEKIRYNSKEVINQAEIDKGMPEVSVENIQATIERLMADADLIYKRGIANVFSKLDRRFRSHDGFKIGSRIILNCAFDEYGWWSHYGRAQDKLMDIERVFYTLEGLKCAPKAYGGSIGLIDQARHNGTGARQTEIDTAYFKLRIFINGNLHIWFKRDDLVKRVNLILADWYGETIGDGQTKEDPFSDIKHTPAKRYGFFPTPPGATTKVFEEVNLLRKKSDPRLRILEPSAGTGNLARACVNYTKEFIEDVPESRREDYRAEYRDDVLVDCVEIQTELADKLKSEGIYGSVYNQDFLQITPATTGLYDRVIMNPPFDRERDIDHVMHALKFLKEGGTLTAIVSAGTEFRQTKKSIAFRKLMDELGAKWRDLPPGSFSESGTNVNTMILQVHK